MKVKTYFPTFLLPFGKVLAFTFLKYSSSANVALQLRQFVSLPFIGYTAPSQKKASFKELKFHFAKKPTFFLSFYISFCVKEKEKESLDFYK